VLRATSPLTSTDRWNSKLGRAVLEYVETGTFQGLPCRQRHPAAAPEMGRDEHREVGRPSVRMSPSMPVV